MKNLKVKENKKNEIDNLDNILDDINMIKKTVYNMMKGLYLIMLIILLLVIIIFIWSALTYFPIQFYKVNINNDIASAVYNRLKQLTNIVNRLLNLSRLKSKLKYNSFKVYL